MRIEAVLDALDHIARNDRAAQSVVLITWTFRDMPSDHADLVEVVCK
jgi:hypothetical protein